jgi:hypothetical protein
MTGRNATPTPRSDAGKVFAAENRDLTVKEREAQRVAANAAKTARLRELRLAKETEASATAKPVKRPHK